jgi:hypothetical protein
VNISMYGICMYTRVIFVVYIYIYIHKYINVDKDFAIHGESGTLMSKQVKCTDAIYVKWSRHVQTKPTRSDFYWNPIGWKRFIVRGLALGPIRWFRWLTRHPWKDSIIPLSPSEDATCSPLMRPWQGQCRRIR